MRVQQHQLRHEASRWLLSMSMMFMIPREEDTYLRYHILGT